MNSYQTDRAAFQRLAIALGLTLSDGTPIVLGVESVKDGMPDIYTLASLDGTRKYEFIPHNGLTRIA